MQFLLVFHIINFIMGNMCLDLMSAMVIYVYMLQELHYYIKCVLSLRSVADEFFGASAD